MQVHREQSHVMSARIMCAASAGSVNSTHSRAKSRPTSRLRGSSSGRRLGMRHCTAATVEAMRLGVLDVGSNTVHLLVVDAHRGGHPMPTHSEKNVLRLAELVSDTGRLSRAGADALVK